MLLRTTLPLRTIHRSTRPMHTLRAYQAECIEHSLSALQRNIRRQAVSLPVGSGKTVVFAHLLQRVPGTPQMSKTLVLAHRTELLMQAARQIQRAAPNLHVALEQGKAYAPAAADVVVASVASLARESRLQGLDPQRFKCLIIDEAHHAAAPTYRRILDHFTRGNPELLVWGCSATLQRHDGLGLRHAFDEIVYRRGFTQMIKEGWLSRLRAVSVRTNASLKNVRSRLGDFATDQLAREINSPERNALVVHAYEKLAEGRRATLVFAVDVAHARALESLFASRLGKQHVGCVLGETLAVERARVVAQLGHTVRVAISCGVLTEGTDVPLVDCVMLARPTRSAGLFQQMVGRGMRLAEGKKDCLVVDFVDALDGPLPQVTVPSLLGLDPAVLLEETDVLDRRELMRQAAKHKPLMSREDALALLAVRRLQAFAGQDFSDQDSQPADQYNPPDPTPDLIDAVVLRTREHLDPLSLFTAAPKALDSVTSGSTHMRKLSRLAWVCVSPTRYLLATRSAVYFLTLHDAVWRGSIMLQGKFYTRERPLNLKALDLAHAVHAVDTLVKEKTPRFELQMLEWAAAWRSKPATDKQINALKRLGVRAPNKNVESAKDVAAGREEKDPASLLTRGAAANLFLRLSHGAAAAWRDTEAAAERAKQLVQRKPNIAWRDVETAACAEDTPESAPATLKPLHAGLWSDDCN